MRVLVEKIAMGFVLLLLSCSPGESAVKLVIGDPEGLVPGTIDSLVVTCAYYDPESELGRERLQFQVEKMPQSIIVYRGKEASYGVRFWIDGLGEGRRILSAYQSVLFLSSGMRTVEVVLTRDCLDKCLEEGEYCENGRCRPDASPLFPETDASVDEDAVEGEDTYGEDPTVEVDVPDETVEPPPGLLWVSIPAGAFYMGCSPGDTQCLSSESPRHLVTVSAFRMTETEITQAQYEHVTGSNPSYFTDCPDCPVEQVDWYQAKTFCEAIGYRLPSEAEWEYAARAGTETPWTCVDSMSSCLGDIAWYYLNSLSETHAVGDKTANAFGLYDMIGNVWEWVEDCWHETYAGAPTTGTVWSGGDCFYRVMHGGGWFSQVENLRISGRGWVLSSDKNRYYGFRCAK